MPSSCDGFHPVQRPDFLVAHHVDLADAAQKIDVELGARLFHHLLSLPLSYFEKRRVGDTVTQARQLETIREFLTNASLTVLVDPTAYTELGEVIDRLSPPAEKIEK